MNLSKYFTVAEMGCKGGTCCNHSAPMDRAFMKRLDKLRESLGVPLYVTSGFRCNFHNAYINGAKYSKHREGIAADLTSDQISMDELEASAKALGFYVIKHEDFCHIDDRFYEVKC